MYMSLSVFVVGMLLTNFTLGEKPFVCEEGGCEKAYAAQYTLKQHKKKDHKDTSKPTNSSAPTSQPNYDLVSCCKIKVCILFLIDRNTLALILRTNFVQPVWQMPTFAACAFRTQAV